MTETCCNITPFHIKDENKEKLSKTIIYADEKALDALGENRKVIVLFFIYIILLPIIYLLII